MSGRGSIGSTTSPSYGVFHKPISGFMRGLESPTFYPREGGGEYPLYRAHLKSDWSDP